MSLRAAIALPCAFAALACASPRPARAPSPPAARARFAPVEGDAVFEQAVRTVARAGYHRRSCDPERRRLETTLVEFDAPCGETTCLARQSVEVLLGYRVARVRVQRELYDGAWRAWQDEVEEESVDAARDLLERILGSVRPRETASASRPGSAAADPCASAAGEAGTRVARATRR